MVTKLTKAKLAQTLRTSFPDDQIKQAIRALGFKRKSLSTLNRKQLDALHDFLNSAPADSPQLDEQQASQTAPLSSVPNPIQRQVPNFNANALQSIPAQTNFMPQRFVQPAQQQQLLPQQQQFPQHQQHFHQQQQQLQRHPHQQFPQHQQQFTQHQQQFRRHPQQTPIPTMFNVATPINAPVPTYPITFPKAS